MVQEVTLSPRVLANALRPVLLRLARELRRETEQLGLTGRQVALLWRVKQRPRLTLRALAAAEGISPPALSAHVDRLEQAGLLVRVRSEVDRRRVGLELTDEGERRLRRVRERRTTWLASRLGMLAPDELATVEAAIAPLLKLIEGPEAVAGDRA